MGRKNNSARERNNKGRLDRREHGVGRPIRDRSVPRLAVEDMVMPDGTCLRNSLRPKAKFNTEAKAQKALEQAQRQRARMGSGHVEKRFYLCDETEGGCGGFHLTSRETYDAAWKRTV